QGPRGSDRVRRPAALGAAGVRARTVSAPRGRPAGCLGRLHVRHARPRADPAAHPAAAGAGAGAEPAAGRALRTRRRRSRRPRIRPRRHRRLPGGRGAGGGAAGPHQRPRGTTVGAGAPRGARRPAPARPDSGGLGWRGAPRRGAGRTAAAASAEDAGGMMRVVAAALGLITLGAPLGGYPAPPVAGVLLGAVLVARPPLILP